MKLLRFNPKKSKAQAMVEFAIVLPILLLVVYGLIEVGRLIFLVASVNNATRQAARYGSTSGVGPNGPRYLDCNGIRNEVQRMDFLNIINDADIDISYDDGSGTIVGDCNGSTYNSIVRDPETNDRVVVTINSQFDTLVPLVPLDPRPINAESSRTLLLTLSIEPPKKPTITLITSDAPDYSLIGQAVTVEVTVTAIGSTPTGNVVVTADDGATCSADISLVSGAGSCEIVFSTPGDKLITASYYGDANHDISSDTENHTVKAATTLTVADAPDPTLPNETVYVSVTVHSGWSGTPTGTVTITGADTSSCPPLTGGTTTCTVSFATEGNKTLTATYSGDATYEGSTKDEAHLVILPGVTITTITSTSPNPSQVNGSVTVTVAVTSTSTPTGTVAITGANTNCTITLAGGTGSCDVVFTSIGNKTLTATYTPDTPAFQGSSGTATHTVALPATTTTITSDAPDPSSPGQSVTVSVTVAGGSSTPQGTVTISGADTNCSIPLSGGAGSCNVTFNTTGNKTITATYGGDSSHSGSSDTESHTVAIIAPPIPTCDTLTVANLSRIKMVNGNMTIDIANPFGVLLQISSIKVTWNHDLGHKTTNDKSLKLDKVNLGSQIWDGYEFGPDATIIPTSPAVIAANSIATLEFVFHQELKVWDDTESVELFFMNDGCGSVHPKQTQHE
jgi:hypothetical protein